jgi:hypothetical protein
MKGYYDKIVPTQLAKLTKKLDPEAKIERDSIQTQDTPRSLAYFLKWAEARGDTRPRPALAVLWANGADEPFVQQFMKETSGLEVPSLTITPKMREAIMQGLPSYAEGGEVEASESEESKQAEIKECLLDLRTVAKERKVYRPKLAYLIRQMGGADHSRSQILANNLINDDLDDLVQRLENQPRAVSMIKKLTEKID